MVVSSTFFVFHRVIHCTDMSLIIACCRRLAAFPSHVHSHSRTLLSLLAFFLFSFFVCASSVPRIILIRDTIITGKKKDMPMNTIITKRKKKSTLTTMIIKNAPKVMLDNVTLSVVLFWIPNKRIFFLLTNVSLSKNK